MVVVSLLAMVFDILPVLLAALLSALIWNFFFIPPVFTFHINDTEDLLMFLMYFVIAMVNATLTFKIREQEKKARGKEEKEHAIQLYDTVLNSLSHELRTPVSAIIGAVDMLKENGPGLTEKNKDELLATIGTAGLRLNRQIENLLNMGRVESGMIQLRRDWCDINELIFHVVQKLSDEAINHTIIFNANEDLPFFKLDEGMIEQVLKNIIHNAIQYTPDHSVINVIAMHQNENCVMTVSDNGNGFPVNEIENAFDKFYRLPQSRAGGTGLGLSIAKGFTEAHGGSILLENNIDGGALFTITIPAETTYINKLKNE